MRPRPPEFRIRGADWIIHDLWGCQTFHKINCKLKDMIKKFRSFVIKM
jgi:hypothetical protein